MGGIGRVGWGSGAGWMDGGRFGVRFGASIGKASPRPVSEAKKKSFKDQHN